MEDSLSRVLAFLPRTHKICGYPITIEMKYAAAVCSVALFFYLGAICFIEVVDASHMRYHHWRSALASVQSVVWYSYCVLHGITTALNVIVFVTLCLDRGAAWGLLFVLASLVALVVRSVWLVFVIARHFVDPGLSPDYKRNYTKCPEKKDDESSYDIDRHSNKMCFYLAGYTDYRVWYWFIFHIFFVQFIIIIYTYYKDSQEEEDENEE